MTDRDITDDEVKYLEEPLVPFSYYIVLDELMTFDQLCPQARPWTRLKLNAHEKELELPLVITCTEWIVTKRKEITIDKWIT